jgi:hypothetical protein
MHDFRFSETRIFLRRGLDSPNQLEMAHEISFLTQVDPAALPQRQRPRSRLRNVDQWH